MGAKLPEFTNTIVSLVAIWLRLVLLSPMVSAPELVEVEWVGIREYGMLADEQLVGNGSMQLLADLAHSYEVVKAMCFSPVGREVIICLVAGTLVPIAPVMPAEELLKLLLGKLL